MITLILHISNSQPIKVDVEEMPKPTDAVIIGQNPRERSDKELPWVDDGVSTVMFPWWRINYIQVVPDQMDQVDIPLPYREG
jgi:hypothetical protein